MKLFVWDNPWHVNWGNSMAFAVAETVEDAKRILKNQELHGLEGDGHGDNFEFPEPTRILDIPNGEKHCWSE